MVGQSVEIEVQPNDTIGLVKNVVQEKIGVPSQDQSLFYAGKRLIDKQTLSSTLIKQGDHVKMVQRVQGGPLFTFPNLENKEPKGVMIS